MIELFQLSGVVGHLASVSNLNLSYLVLLWVEMSWVELGLGFDNNLISNNNQQPGPKQQHWQ